MLPPILDAMLKDYVTALADNGGVVNGRIWKAVGRAIVKSVEPRLLQENGGYLKLACNWAHAVAQRFGFVIRKSTKSTKSEVHKKEQISQEFRIAVGKDMRDECAFRSVQLG